MEEGSIFLVHMWLLKAYLVCQVYALSGELYPLTETYQEPAAS